MTNIMPTDQSGTAAEGYEISLKQVGRISGLWAERSEATVAMDGVTDDSLRFCRSSHRDVATVLADGRKVNQPFFKDCMAVQVLSAALAAAVQKGSN